MWYCKSFTILVTGTGISVFKISAECGNSQALYYLSRCYILLQPLEKDYSKPSQYCLKSAEKGNPDALYMLIWFYRDGKGAEQDCSKSFEYCKKAVDADDVSAMKMLAKFYENEVAVQ